MPGRIGVWPAAHIHNIIRERADVVEISAQNAMSWKVGKKIVPTTPSDFITFNYYERVEADLRELTPIYSRHYQSLEMLDLSLRLINLQILSLVENILELQVQVIVMPPQGSSHHLEDSMLEIAAKVAEVPTVFTIALPESDRAITLIQKGEIQTRLPHKHGRDLLLERSLELKVASGWQVPHVITPKYNTDSYEPNTSFTKAIFQQVRRSVIIKTRRDMKNANRPDNEVLIRIQPLTDIRLLSQHRKALNYLEQLEVNSDSKVEKLLKTSSRTPEICLFAHVQPEATSFPEGGSLNNHLDIISQIRALGYTKPILYREHPSSYNYSRGINSFRSGVARSVAYYKTLQELGCVFVPKRLTFEDLPNLSAITMVGSIGLQRSLQGIKTIITGFPWYGPIPGSVSLDQAITDLGQMNQKFNPDQAKEFLISRLTDSTLLSRPMELGKSVSQEELILWRHEYHTFLDSLLS
jgi:hypothetical protein